jgi:hypothetical protein
MQANEEEQQLQQAEGSLPERAIPQQQDETEPEGKHFNSISTTTVTNEPTPMPIRNRPLAQVSFQGSEEVTEAPRQRSVGLSPRGDAASSEVR